MKALHCNLEPGLTGLKMLVQCPNCSTNYKIHDSLVTTSTPTFRCSCCKHIFVLELKREGKPVEEKAPWLIKHAEEEKIKPQTDTIESWDMRLVFRVAYIFPKEAREEWMGDLLEAVRILRDRGHLRLVLMLITLARAGLLLWSLVRIKCEDLVSPRSNVRQRK